MGQCRCKALCYKGSLTPEGRETIEQGRCEPKDATFVALAHPVEEKSQGNQWNFFREKTSAELFFKHTKEAFSLMKVNRSTGVTEIRRRKSKSPYLRHTLRRKCEDMLGIKFPEIEEKDLKEGLYFGQLATFSYYLREESDEEEIKRSSRSYGLTNLTPFKSAQTVWEGGNGFVALREKTVIIVFSGTKSGRDVWADLLSMNSTPFVVNGKTLGEAGVGYTRQYQGLKDAGMLSSAYEHIKTLGASCEGVYIVGHSLGGCVANLCTLEMLESAEWSSLLDHKPKSDEDTKDDGKKIEREGETKQAEKRRQTQTRASSSRLRAGRAPIPIYLHTFGAPRVFDHESADRIHEELMREDSCVRVHRWVLFDDGVPDMTRREVFGHFGDAKLMSFLDTAIDRRDRSTVLRDGRWEFIVRDHQYAPCRYDRVEIGYPGTHRLYHVALASPSSLTAEVWGLSAISRGGLQRKTLKSTCLPTQAQWVIVCEHGPGCFLWYPFRAKAAAEKVFRRFISPSILFEVADNDMIERDGKKLTVSLNSIRKAKDHIVDIVKALRWTERVVETADALEQQHGKIYPCFITDKTCSVKDTRFMVALEKGFHKPTMFYDQPGILHYRWYPFHREQDAREYFDSKTHTKVLFKVDAKTGEFHKLEAVEWNKAIAPGRTKVLEQIVRAAVEKLFFCPMHSGGGVEEMGSTASSSFASRPAAASSNGAITSTAIA